LGLGHSCGPSLAQSTARFGKGGNTIVEHLFVKRALLEGVLLSSLLGLLIVSALYHNAEMWLKDYPPAIQEAFGPISDDVRTHRVVYVAPLAFLLRALLITSNERLKNLSSGKLPFATAFINALLIFSAFNLFDLVIIDYLPFITIQPSFVVLPGTVGTTSYEAVTFHAVNFLKGVGFSLLGSAAVASLTSRRAM